MKSTARKIDPRVLFPSVNSILDSPTPNLDRIESVIPLRDSSPFRNATRSSVIELGSAQGSRPHHIQEESAYRGTSCLLTLKEAAALLSVKTSTIYYWTSRGEIPFISVGRHLRFEKEALLQHFKNISASAKQPRRSQASSRSEVLSQLRSLKSKPPKPSGRSKKE